MLSADFCQLELRILAHFSQDPVLCQLMHEKGDIFKNIASRLNKISEDKVSLIYENSCKYDIILYASTAVLFLNIHCN